MRSSLAAMTLTLLIASIAPTAPLPEPARKDQEFIGVLIEALDDADLETRENIALTLANLGEAAVPSLLDALTYNKSERRMGAAFALGQVRPAAKNAVPALMRALKDPDQGVRRQVSYASSRMVGRDFMSAQPVQERPPHVPAPDVTPASSTLRGPQ